jgi:hypothetical protein
MKIFFTFFIPFFFISILYPSYQTVLREKDIPQEVFLQFLSSFFKTPTHVEAIIVRDKKLLELRLVSKQWNHFFNNFLFSHVDFSIIGRIDFKAMELLFVQERNWPGPSFVGAYKERLTYLKKITIIKNSQCFSDWIANQEQEIDHYPLQGSMLDSSNNYSVGNPQYCIKDPIFDWSIISKLGYEAPDSPDAQKELSFQDFYNYLTNGGFLCNDLIPHLSSFFLDDLDYYIKNGWKDINQRHAWHNVLKQIYFTEPVFFKQCLLNMDFTHFLAVFFCKISKSNSSSRQFKLREKESFSSKEAFKYLEELPVEINYAKFIHDLNLESLTYKSHIAEIFFKKLRKYFTSNNLEDKSFLYHLLEYRLQSYSNNYMKASVPTRSMSNINNLILGFIKAFGDELKKYSDSQKEEYRKLFKDEQKLDLSHTYPDHWYKQYLKKVKKIASYFDSWKL